MKSLFVIFLSLNTFSTELLQKHVSRPLQAESTMEALEPWETPVNGFFIRSHHGVPNFSEKDWVLKIDGMVEKPLTFKLKDLQKLKYKTLHAVLECSGNGRGLQSPSVSGVPWRKGAVGNAEWTGVSVADVLKLAHVKENAKFVTVTGMDVSAKPTVPAFIRSIPIEKILRDDSILAWNMNREPLTVLHGAPVRLILPGWYAQNWIKWITHITVTAAEDHGYYMKKGYRMPRAPVRPGESWDSSTGVPIQEIRVQSFFVTPEPNQVLKKGMINFRGKAFSGSGLISKVEISTDNGKTWQKSNLLPPHTDGGWQEFETQIEFPNVGSYQIISRATDEKGNVQPLEHEWNPGGYLRNAVDVVNFEVQDEVAPSGLALVRTKCLVCHTNELIEAQRLTRNQWEGVFQKMEGFGATLSAAEKTIALNYLTTFSPDRVKCDVPAVAAPAEELALKPLIIPKGNAARGAKLFALTCIACHGEKGEGKIGPAIHGRNVPALEFWQTVLYGKREMPAFNGQLNRQNVSDLQAYLQNSTPK